MSSRNRYSTAQPTPSRGTPAFNRAGPATLELPPYRQPSHPLNPAAKQKLQEIYNNRTAANVRVQNDKVVKNITKSAELINEHLKDQTDIVKRMQKKWDEGKHLHDREEKEQDLQKLQESVDAMTNRLEKSVRDAIDNAEAAQRIEDSLKWLRETAPRQLNEEYETQMTQRTQSQTQRRRQSDEDEDEDIEDEEGPTPGPTPLGMERVALTGLDPMFKDRMERKKAEYQSYSHHARYAKNNDYIGFRGIAHDARHGDDGDPMPHADTWFREHDPPAPGITATQQNADDSDDDIIVDKANVSTKCPLTLRQFKEPITSKKCPHTFEKDAIYDYIRKSGSGTGAAKWCACPISGCDQNLQIADLYENPVLVRKIKRMQKADAQAAEESDSDDEIAPPRHSHSTQSGFGPGSARPSSSNIVDLGDPSDEEDDDDE